MKTSNAQRSLAIIWFFGATLLFTLLFLQTIGGAYADNGSRENDLVENTRDAWGWLLPNIMPSLSLIVGVLVYQEKRNRREGAVVSWFMFFCAAFFSILYLTFVTVTIVYSNDAAVTLDVTKLMFMTKISNFYLGPLQGITCGVLAVFFAEQGEDRSESTLGHPNEAEALQNIPGTGKIA